jgi:transposase InsO family protein
MARHAAPRIGEEPQSAIEPGEDFAGSHRLDAGGGELDGQRHTRRWATRADARRDLIRCIEGWFNARRLDSSNNYNSPIGWEHLHYRRGDGIAA